MIAIAVTVIIATIGRDMAEGDDEIDAMMVHGVG